LDGPADDYYHGLVFGWEFFTCATPAAKRDYLAAQLFGACTDALRDDYAARCVVQ
jgi:hypothetical protein